VLLETALDADHQILADRVDLAEGADALAPTAMLFVMLL
jgi:hypothetical protein